MNHYGILASAIIEINYENQLSSTFFYFCRTINLRAYGHFITKKAPAWMFLRETKVCSCEYRKISKNTYFKDHLQTTTSTHYITHEDSSFLESHWCSATWHISNWTYLATFRSDCLMESVLQISENVKWKMTSGVLFKGNWFLGKFARFLWWSLFDGNAARIGFY